MFGRKKGRGRGISPALNRLLNQQAAAQGAHPAAVQRAQQAAALLAQQNAAQGAPQAAAPRAQQAAERRAKAEADRRAKVEAERRAKAEAQRRAKAEADRRAKAEAERRAKAEAERRAKAEAERRAKAEADRRAKAEADRRAKAEADRRAKAEADRRAKAEADRKAKVVESRDKVFTNLIKAILERKFDAGISPEQIEEIRLMISNDILDYCENLSDDELLNQSEQDILKELEPRICSFIVKSTTSFQEDINDSNKKIFITNIANTQPDLFVKLILEDDSLLSHFGTGCNDGDTVAEHLINTMFEKFDMMTPHQRINFLRWLDRYGGLDKYIHQAIHLAEKYSDNEVQNELQNLYQKNNYKAFGYFAKNGDINGLENLMDFAPAKQFEMIAANGLAAFSDDSGRIRLDVLEFLTMKDPELIDGMLNQQIMKFNREMRDSDPIQMGFGNVETIAFLKEKFPHHLTGLLMSPGCLEALYVANKFDSFEALLNCRDCYDVVLNFLLDNPVEHDDDGYTPDGEGRPGLATKGLNVLIHALELRKAADSLTAQTEHKHNIQQQFYQKIMALLSETKTKRRKTAICRVLKQHFNADKSVDEMNVEKAVDNEEQLLAQERALAEAKAIQVEERCKEFLDVIGTLKDNLAELRGMPAKEIAIRAEERALAENIELAEQSDPWQYFRTPG